MRVHHVETQNLASLLIQGHTWPYLSSSFIRCFSGATPGIPGVAPEKQRSSIGEIQAQS
ncbi:MAG: hypothetical protein WD625_03215 [Balneolales bacterium]